MKACLLESAGRVILYEERPCCKVAASLTWKRREVVRMSTYEVLTLLALFGTFLVALLAYIDSRNNKRK